MFKKIVGFTQNLVHDENSNQIGSSDTKSIAKKMKSGWKDKKQQELNVSLNVKKNFKKIKAITFVMGLSKCMSSKIVTNLDTQR